MAIVMVDGKEVDLAPGERLNGIQAAERAGVDIPHYCWHPGLSVVASCRMCLVETGTRNAETGAITMLPKLVPACQTPAKDGTVFVTNSEKVAAKPGDGRGRPADRSSDRLPDLRQGGRVLAARLSLRARPGRAAGRHPALHQPPARDGRHGHAVRRSLRDVQPLRAVHARDQRHQRADGHQPRQPRGDRRLPRLPAGQQAVGQRGRSVPGRGAGRQGLSLPAARLVHEAARRASAPAARPAARSTSKRIRTRSTGSSRARIRTSTSGGCATRGATASITCTATDG